MSEYSTVSYRGGGVNDRCCVGRDADSRSAAVLTCFMSDDNSTGAINASALRKMICLLF